MIRRQIVKILLIQSRPHYLFHIPVNITFFNLKSYSDFIYVSYMTSTSNLKFRYGYMYIIILVNIGRGVLRFKHPERSHV